MSIKHLIREAILLTEAPQKPVKKTKKQSERPQAVSFKGKRGADSWGSYRIIDKRTKEGYKVIDMLYRDPDDEDVITDVVIQADDGKKKTVTYDEYLGDYIRHVGQPVKSLPGRSPQAVAAWVKLEKQKADKEANKIQGAVTDPVTSQYGPMTPEDEALADVEQLPAGTKWKREPGVILQPGAESESDADKIAIMALEKLELATISPKLYKTLTRPYIQQYKLELVNSLFEVQKALSKHMNEIIASNQIEIEELKLQKELSLDDDKDYIAEIDNDIKELEDEIAEYSSKSNKPEKYAALFFDKNVYDNIIKKLVIGRKGEGPDRSRGAPIPNVHIDTIGQIAAERKRLDFRDFKQEVAVTESEDLKDIDEIIRNSKGFVTWLDGLKEDGAKVSNIIWNKMREEAERKGKYRGQF